MTRRCAWIVLPCFIAGSVLAAPADAQRERIAAERTAAIARFNDEEHACRERFAAAACLDAARKEQAATFKRLKKQSMLLDEAKRRETAAARTQVIRDKAVAQQARASEPRAAPPREGVRERSKASSPAGELASDDLGLPRPAKGTRALPGDRRAAELKNQDAFDARVRAAHAHREAVEQRTAEQAAHGKRAAPLPLPAGASAP